MSLLVLGLSHHGAPIGLLEAAALDPASRGRLESTIVGSEHVVEAVVVSTCNRTEVYAEGLTFHGALTDVSEALAAATGVPLPDLQPHLYVHYEDRGIAHAFSVAAGLDSMAVGEAQILGAPAGGPGPAHSVAATWARRSTRFCSRHFGSASASTARPASTT